jgi:hypothetical protein
VLLAQQLSHLPMSSTGGHSLDGTRLRHATALTLALLLGVAGSAARNLVITPTTTLTAETGNNTSSANSYLTSTNGNLGAGNVSKVDIRKLLYPGATTNFYAHLMPWWGLSNHINIGYAYKDDEYPQSPTSLDPQITKQVDDMLSRGIPPSRIDANEYVE